MDARGDDRIRGHPLDNRRCHCCIPRGKRPLLVRIGPLERITPDARQLLLDDTCSARTAVVEVDDVGRVITAFNYKSATLSRYFAEESDAIAWLTEATHPSEVFSRS